MTVKKEYSNGEVTLLWDSSKCIHSAICLRGLPAVFDVARSPWIDVQAAPSEAIVRTVGACPSGALSMKTVVHPGASDDSVRITVRAHGPLAVEGRIAIVDASGVVSIVEGATALCRCGGSKNKPYCDGTHRSNGF